MPAAARHRPIGAIRLFAVGATIRREMTAGNGRVVWFGHATVLIELDQVRLLTDPLLLRRVAHLRRAVPLPAEEPRDLDAVLVSHVHYDHLHLASLGRLGRAVPIVAPRGAGALLRRHGFTGVREVDEGEEVAVGGIAVRATHAEHSASRGLLAGHAPAVGFLVAGSLRVYFAGDTGLFDGMRTLAPDLDVALLPVAGWGSRLPRGHLDPDAAATALTLLRPRVAVPIHWGTLMPAYRRRPHAAEAGEAFAARAHVVAPDVDVRVLAVGEPLDLAAALGADGVRPIRPI